MGLSVWSPDTCKAFVILAILASLVAVAGVAAEAAGKSLPRSSCSYPCALLSAPTNKFLTFTGGMASGVCALIGFSVYAANGPQRYDYGFGSQGYDYADGSYGYAFYIEIVTCLFGFALAGLAFVSSAWFNEPENRERLETELSLFHGNPLAKPKQNMPTTAAEVATVAGSV
jgi:hypothetical protein